MLSEDEELIVFLFTEDGCTKFTRVLKIFNSQNKILCLIHDLLKKYTFASLVVENLH